MCSAIARRLLAHQFVWSCQTTASKTSSRWWLAPISVLVLLVSCRGAPVREPPQGQPWPQARTELQDLSSFELKGRVAVAAGAEGFNARLRWEQSGDGADLSLEGPLGVGGLQITATANDLSLTTSRGERLDSQAAREELRRRLGFEPPLSSLRYWVLGVPDPAYPASETVDERQRLVGLQQEGWNIEYSAYAPAGDRLLPRRLNLMRDDVRVRLLIDSWESLGTR
jgi:outer membrane lipoprotein LolB